MAGPCSKPAARTVLGPTPRHKPAPTPSRPISPRPFSDWPVRSRGIAAHVENKTVIGALLRSPFSLCCRPTCTFGVSAVQFQKGLRGRRLRHGGQAKKNIPGLHKPLAALFWLPVL